MSMESPTRRSSVSGFSESLDGAGKRQKKLLMLQKKMQMSDAMEKRMQLEHFKASGTGGKGGRLSSQAWGHRGDEQWYTGTIRTVVQCEDLSSQAWGRRGES